MKKIIVILALCLGITGVQAQKEGNIQLNGTVVDTVAQYVYLQKFYNKMFKTVDSVKVVDGKFNFKTKVILPELYGLSVNTKNSPLYIFLDKAPISVKLSPLKYYSGSVVEGSVQQDLFNSYRKKQDVEISAFIKENPSSLVSAYVLYRNWSYRLSPEQITANIALLDKSLLSITYVKELKELVKVLNGLAVGKKSSGLYSFNSRRKTSASLRKS